MQIGRVQSCVRPVDAALIAAGLKAGGLHFGNVMYGNVGAPKRLDFTVIGSAANVAARLSAHCKTLGQTLLMSADVARYVPETLRSLGAQRFHNVADELEVFALAGTEFG